MPITKPMEIEEACLLEFPKVKDIRGNLAFIENSRHIPFEIKKTQWAYGFKPGMNAPAVALQNTQEVMIALSGSFEIETFFSNQRKNWFLNSPLTGLYIPAMTWKKIVLTSSNTIILSLFSGDFGPGELIQRDIM